MITKEKIEIYKKYKGDIDQWARLGKKKEQKIIDDEDWFLIDEIVQDIQLIKNGQASDEFEIRLNEKLKRVFDEERTLEYLRSLSD